MSITTAEKEWLKRLGNNKPVRDDNFRMRKNQETKKYDQIRPKQERALKMWQE